MRLGIKLGVKAKVCALGLSSIRSGHSGVQFFLMEPLAFDTAPMPLVLP